MIEGVSERDQERAGAAGDRARGDASDCRAASILDHQTICSARAPHTSSKVSLLSEVSVSVAGELRGRRIA